MTFDFVSRRYWFYMLSFLLIVPGVVSLVLPGGLRPGIDFTSGTIMTIQFDNPVEVGALRNAFEQLGHSEAIIQQSSETTFVVRTGAPGHYHWQCFNPCGGGSTGWKGPMADMGYMQGTVTVA